MVFNTQDGALSILITGCNQGIGYLSAEILLATQDKLTLYVAARSEEKATKAVESLKKSAKGEHKLIPIVLDVTKDEDIEAAKAAIPELDILVNNAGIAIHDDMSSPASLRKQYQEVYNTNVFGPAALTVALLPALEKSKEKNPKRRPAIINVSSEIGSIGGKLNGHPQIPPVPFLVYPSSKAALNFLTAYVAVEHPDIRCVSTSPTYCSTNLNRYSGPRDPKEGAQLVVNAILDHDGKTGRFYAEHGEDFPW